MSEMSSINNRVYRTISSSIVIGERESITVVPEPGLEDYYFIGADGIEFRHTNTPIKKIKYQVSPKVAYFVNFRKPAFWRRVHQAFIGPEDID